MNPHKNTIKYAFGLRYTNSLRVLRITVKSVKSKLLLADALHNN
jgi:hypothetical protein